MHTEKITLNDERNVTLTVHLLEEADGIGENTKRPAVMVIPGGAYQYCSERESEPVAKVYGAAGYHTFILNYSVGKDALWPNPLEDYEMAMDLIREKAEGWNVLQDKIAVVGFSAGGHLAAAAATIAKNKPNAAILGYAVTTNDVKGCEPSAPELISKVDGTTPPCFLFAARTDDTVPVRNSLAFMQALEQAGISFESHIYGYGPHGFSTCDASIQEQSPSLLCRRTKNWVTDSIGWLEDVFGTFGANGVTEPLCFAHVNGNYEKTLSADCTVGHLMKNPAAVSVLSPLLAQATGANATETQDTKNPLPQELLLQMMENVRLRDVLRMFGAADAAEQIDILLRQIENL